MRGYQVLFLVSGAGLFLVATSGHFGHALINFKPKWPRPLGKLEFAEEPSWQFGHALDYGTGVKGPIGPRT